MERHYILVTEDNTVCAQHGELTADDTAIADDGRLDIIDVTDPEKPMQYVFDGKWTELL